MEIHAPKFIAPVRTEFAADLRRQVRAYFADNNLSQKDDGTVIRKAWIMLGLYMLPFLAVVFASPMPGWALLLLALVQGIGMAGVGMNIMHDSLHGSLSSSQKINERWGNTMYLLGGSVFGCKMQHNRAHHTYTNVIGFDEDIRDRKYLRFSAQAPWYPIQQYQHWYALFLYPFMTITMFIKNFTALADYEREGLLAEAKTTYKKQLLGVTTSTSLYVLIFVGAPMLVSGVGFWASFGYFMAVQMVAGFIMAVVFQLAHVVEEAAQPATCPSGNILNDWMVHQLDTTVNFCPNNRLLNWYVGGLNFQVEHHLFPNISHIHYPALSGIVRQTAEKYGYTYNQVPTFAGIMQSHMRFLKYLGQRPDSPKAPRPASKIAQTKRANQRAKRQIKHHTEAVPA